MKNDMLVSFFTRGMYERSQLFKSIGAVMVLVGTGIILAADNLVSGDMYAPVTDHGRQMNEKLREFYQGGAKTSETPGN